MKPVIIILSICLISSTVMACNHPVKHYSTMGCIASDELDAEGCPLSYYCPSLYERDPDKCYLLGREYDIGQQVPPEQSFSGCYFLSCSQNFENVTEFAVAIVDCFFPFEEDCVLQFEPHQCCFASKVCGDDREKLAVCTINNQSYYEGERVYFEDMPCHTCVCSRPSDGCLGGILTCQELQCDFEVFYSEKLLEDAAPVYDDNSCCPIDWRLPEESDAILPGSGSHFGSSPYQKCIYGNLTLNQGDMLVPSITQDGTFECSCAIPPLVHCFFERNVAS